MQLHVHFFLYIVKRYTEWRYIVVFYWPHGTIGAPFDIEDTIRLGAPYDIDTTVRLGATYDISDIVSTDYFFSTKNC